MTLAFLAVPLATGHRVSDARGRRAVVAPLPGNAQAPDAGFFLIASQALRVAVGNTSAWQAFARWFVS